MAKKSIKPVCSGGPTAEVASEPVVTPESIAEAERDLNILIEAQRIRRDPARFMAAKALPQAQRHYIV